MNVYVHGLLVLNVRVIFPLAKWSFSTAGTDNPPLSPLPEPQCRPTWFLLPGCLPRTGLPSVLLSLPHPPPENAHQMLRRAPRFIIRDEFRFGSFRRFLTVGLFHFRRGVYVAATVVVAVKIACPCSFVVAVPLGVRTKFSGLAVSVLRYLSAGCYWHQSP